MLHVSVICCCLSNWFSASVQHPLSGYGFTGDLCTCWWHIYKCVVSTTRTSCHHQQLMFEPPSWWINFLCWLVSKLDLLPCCLREITTAPARHVQLIKLTSWFLTLGFTGDVSKCHSHCVSCWQIMSLPSCKISFLSKTCLSFACQE
jgi:hypothetical protein